MTLPKGFSVVSAFKCDYWDFEELVKATYGHKFEFVADQVCGNDTSHEFNNYRKAPLNDWNTKELLKFKVDGHGSYLANILLQDMVNNDVLPEGSYLIRVSW